jgi:hypothetical protein
MSPPRTKAIVRPSGEKAGSVSVGSSVSWLRCPSRTAKRPPLATPPTVDDLEKTTAPVDGAAMAAPGAARDARDSRAKVEMSSDLEMSSDR